MRWPDLTSAGPQESSAAAATADLRKRDQSRLTRAGGCRFAPLSHETCGRAGLAAFKLLNKLQDVAAVTGAFFEHTFLMDSADGLRIPTYTQRRAVPGQARAAPRIAPDF